MEVNKRAPSLLTLPYDIRWLINGHLFPESDQIYLIAQKAGLHQAFHGDPLPMQMFLVCRQMNAEAGDYLYNNYLFNVFGHKKDCIAHYRPVLAALFHYARNGAELDVRDNGLLSATACVSIYAKGGKAEATARGRERGARRELHEIEAEVRDMADSPGLPSSGHTQRTAAQFGRWLVAEMLDRIGRLELTIATAIVAACMAWCALQYRDQTAKETEVFVTAT